MDKTAQASSPFFAFSSEQSEKLLNELNYLNSKVIVELKEARLGEISKTFSLVLEKYNESSAEIKNLIDGKTSFFKKATDELFEVDGVLAQKIRSMNEAVELIRAADKEAFKLIEHISLDDLPKKVEKKLHEALMVLENNFAIETKDQVRSLRTLATDLKLYMEQLKSITIENRAKIEAENRKITDHLFAKQNEFFNKLKEHEETTSKKMIESQKSMLQNSTQILKNIEVATANFNALEKAKVWGCIVSGFAPGFFIGMALSFFVLLFSSPIFKAIVQATK